MKLKYDVDLPAFLLKVDLCPGEVLYTTQEGVCLNLKSQLSKYVFLAAANAKSSSLLHSGSITCSESTALETLRPYLAES